MRLSVCETLRRERFSVNKNEARALLMVGQSQVLSARVQDGFNQSITEEALPVNMKRMGWHVDFELNGVRGDERGSGRHRAIFAQKRNADRVGAYGQSLKLVQRWREPISCDVRASRAHSQYIRCGKRCQEFSRIEAMILNRMGLGGGESKAGRNECA